MNRQPWFSMWHGLNEMLLIASGWKLSYCLCSYNINMKRNDGDAEYEIANSLAIGIFDAIDEVIMMVKKGYELNVETWLDPTLEYG